MKNIGLKKGTVKIVLHQKHWHSNFQKEKSLILSLNNKLIKSIEHVGSTSIPKMPAKPIIDIIVGIDKYKNTAKLLKPLSKIGYKFRFEPRAYQSLFIKGDGVKDTHYLKVLKYKGNYWDEYMGFKKALLENKKSFVKYKNLKLKLWKNSLNDRKKYTKGKAKLIKAILEH